MKTLTTLIALLISQSGLAQASRSVQIDTGATQIEITDARFTLLPTKTEIRPIAHCNPNCEQGLPVKKSLLLNQNPQL